MNYQLKTAVLFWALFSVISCSDSKTSSEKDSQEISIDPTESNEAFAIPKEQHNIISEQLFFFLRKEVLNVDANTFIKYEHLNIDGYQFQYAAVIIDKEMLHTIASNNTGTSTSIFKLANYASIEIITDLGDSININGKFIIDQTLFSNTEKSLKEVKIDINALITSSYLSASPYAYSGYERELREYKFNKPLILSLNQPRIYSNSELYLKARITQLTKEDLGGLSSVELSYLRNEIFARHGHAFKTDKMKTYFNGKDWYRPYYEDATPFLNKTEKKNVDFIKSLEG